LTFRLFPFMLHAMLLNLRDLLWLGLVWACLVGPGLPAAEPAAAPAGEPAPLRPSYRLRARDTIRVGVINEADTLVERRINPDGTVDIPFLKEIVKVGGLTVSEAQAALEKLYLKYFKRPQVVLSIVSYAERRVYVNGFVGKPGSVLVPPEETLTLGRALSMAGGMDWGATRALRWAGPGHPGQFLIAYAGMTAGMMAGMLFTCGVLEAMRRRVR